MVRNKLNRKVAEEQFNYGNHIIEVHVKIKYGYCSRGLSNVMNDVSGERYYRQVKVKAKENKGFPSECSHETNVALDIEERTERHWLFWEKEYTIPSVEEHIEYTTEPVLEQLDEIYQYTNKDIDIDVETSMQDIKHEMSWVEVEDDIERISKEIDAIAQE